MRRVTLPLLLAGFLLVPAALTLSARPIGLFSTVVRETPLSEIAVDNLGNLLLLVPVAAIVTYAWRAPWWLVIGAGATLSATFELLQASLLPHRDPTPRDVAFNAVGAAIGWALGRTAATRPN